LLEGIALSLVTIIKAEEMEEASRQR